MATPVRLGPREKQLRRETNADGGDQRDHQRLDERKPLFCRKRISSTSAQVITQPQTSGMPKSNCNPMADPITSARSQAAIAISHRTQRNQTVGFE